MPQVTQIGNADSGFFTPGSPPFHQDLLLVDEEEALLYQNVCGATNDDTMQRQKDTCTQRCFEIYLTLLGENH